MSASKIYFSQIAELLRLKFQNYTKEQMLEATIDYAAVIFSQCTENEKQGWLTRLTDTTGTVTKVDDSSA